MENINASMIKKKFLQHNLDIQDNYYKHMQADHSYFFEQVS